MILESYQRTKSTILTAQELNMNKRRVSGLIQRAGVPLTKSHGGVCYQHKNEIEQWAKEGISFSEIARRIGTKHQLVKKFLVDHGIEYKPYRQAMENNTFWRGGRVIDYDGYVLIKNPDHPYKDRHGYVREHRLVMEQQLGRYLLPTEVVHHKDNNKQNNTPDNLEVFGSNAEHLAETLKGQVPKWTDEGKKRLSEQKPRKISLEEEEEIQLILASYQRTQSTILTSAELNVSRNRIARILKQNDIPLSRLHPIRKPTGVCYRHQAELAQWAKEGVTVAEMARRIGAQRQVIQKYFESHGIEYRTRRKQANVSQTSNDAQISNHPASETNDCPLLDNCDLRQELPDIDQQHLF